MNSLAVASGVLGLLFTSALVGMAIRSVLSEQYRDTETREVVRVAMGLIATLSALVLGLVVATAKSSYDDKNNQVRQITARIIYLDVLLAEYGPESNLSRRHLRRSIDQVVARVWWEEAAKEKAPFEAADDSLAYARAIEQLVPQNDAQRSLQIRAIQTVGEIMQARLLLFAQTGGSIPTPFLLILAFWLATLFVSFTLLSQTNLIAFAALGLSALSIASAIFLILELDRPFTGYLRIPDTQLRRALPPVAGITTSEVNVHAVSSPP
jgi:hypothetical protein